MMIYTVKLLIACVPFPAQWTVDVTHPDKAPDKARAQMRRCGLKGGKVMETEIVRRFEVGHN